MASHVVALPLTCLSTRSTQPARAHGVPAGADDFTLSQPVSSIMLGGLETLVVNFIGAFWLSHPHKGSTGFFASECAAVGYALSVFDDEVIKW